MKLSGQECISSQQYPLIYLRRIKIEDITFGTSLILFKGHNAVLYCGLGYSMQVLKDSDAILILKQSIMELQMNGMIIL